MTGLLRPWAAALAAAFFAVPAPGDLPPAMDRLPPDAAVVAGIRNVSQFQSGISAVAALFGEDEEDADGLGMLREMVQTPGLDPDGSAAFAWTTPGDNSSMLVILTVRDFDALVGALGGEAGPAVRQITFQGEEMFAADIGGGFAAIAPERAALEGFEAPRGSSEAINAMMGATARSIADASDAFVVANMRILGPTVQQGLDVMAAQMQMMGAMMGPGPAANFQVFHAIAQDFTRDAQSGIVGIKSGESGVTLDFGGHFTEGSRLAEYFGARAGPASLLARLPAQPYMFAFSLDLGSAGLKRFITDTNDRLREALPPDAQQAPNLMMPGIEKVDGASFVMGTSPAGIMGGLFINSIGYAKTADPAGYIAELRKLFTEIDGMTIDGLTYDTDFKENATTVAGKKVHAWSLGFEADPENPMGLQLQQMQMALFGPSGPPGGFLSATDDGVVMTYSRNSKLIEQALAAAADGRAGLAADPSLRSVMAELPADRSIEAAIGVKGILDMVAGFMAMMGPGFMEFEAPEHLPPIGIGGTTHTGGVRLAVFVPTPVLATIGKLQEAFAGPDFDDDDWEFEMDEDETGQPRF